MDSEKNLQQLFHETLKDIYFAEKKFLSAPSRDRKTRKSQDLKPPSTHETETEEHVARLEKVFKEIDERRAGRPATPSSASSRKARK